MPAQPPSNPRRPPRPAPDANRGRILDYANPARHRKARSWTPTLIAAAVSAASLLMGWNLGLFHVLGATLLIIGVLGLYAAVVVAFSAIPPDEE